MSYWAASRRSPASPARPVRWPHRSVSRPETAGARRGLARDPGRRPEGDACRRCRGAGAVTLPYRAAGILLNGKEADLNQNAGSIERQLRVHSRWVAGTQNMNHTQTWLARVRPRHNPAEKALIANMRDDPHIPWLDSLAAMRHYARQRWPHDPGVQSLITGVWQRYQRWHDRNLESAL